MINWHYLSGSNSSEKSAYFFVFCVRVAEKFYEKESKNFLDKKDTKNLDFTIQTDKETIYFQTAFLSPGQTCPNSFITSVIASVTLAIIDHNADKVIICLPCYLSIELKQQFKDRKDVVFWDAEFFENIAEEEKYSKIFQKVFIDNFDITFTNLPKGITDNIGSKDLLGRDGDAFRLAKIIAYNKTETPLNISICGNWGVGKSTFIKLIQNNLIEFNKLKHKKKNKVETCIVNFNAWQYDDKNQILIALFQGIFNEYKKENRLRTLFDFIFTTIKSTLVSPIVISATILFGILISIPSNNFSLDIKTFGIIASIIIGIFKITENIFGSADKIFNSYNNILKNKNFTDELHLRYKIVEKFECILSKWMKSRKRLVIFIDDLDRCSDECLIELINVLMTFLNKPNIVSILPIDKNVIIKVISKKFLDQQNKDLLAVSFLEKIFQLNYNILNVTDYSKYIDEQFITMKSIEDKKVNINKKGYSETSNNLNTNDKNKKVKKVSDSVEIDNATLDLIIISANYFKFSPRKIKQIINLIKIVHLDLVENNVSFDRKILVITIFLLENYSELLSYFSASIDSSEKCQNNICDFYEKSTHTNQFIKNYIQLFDLKKDIKIFDIISIYPVIKKYLFSYNVSNDDSFLFCSNFDNSSPNLID